MNIKNLLLLLLFVGTFGTFSAQDTLSESVRIICGKDTLLVNDMLNKTIHTYKDSAIEYIQTFELAMLKDSLIVTPGSYNYYSYKSNSRKDITIQYNPNSNDRVKIAIANINYIKKDNLMNSLMQPVEVLSVVSLLVAPLVSLGKPFNTERYGLVTGASVSMLAVSLTLDIIWGHTIYHTKPYKKKKVWTIQ